VVVTDLISAGDNNKQKTSGALCAAVIFDVCEFLNLVPSGVQDLEIGRCAIGCKAVYTHWPQRFTRGMEVVHGTD
jgi:hypothetical protein